MCDLSSLATLRDSYENTFTMGANDTPCPSPSSGEDAIGIMPSELLVSQNAHAFPALLHDAFLHVVCARLPASVLLAALADARVTPVASPACAAAVVDTLWAVALHLEAEGASSISAVSAAAAPTAGDAPTAPLPVEGAHRVTPEWRALTSLGHALVEHGHASRDACIERLELDLLEGMDLSRSDPVRARLVRTNTRLAFTQRKFNLAHEESEGYAKLAEALVGRRGRVGAAACDSGSLSQGVVGIAGRFSLDPNRVFAVLFDALESRIGELRGGEGVVAFLPAPHSSSSVRDRAVVPLPDEEDLLPLFSGALFSASSLTQLVGFRFRQHARGDQGSASRFAGASSGDADSSADAPLLPSASPALHTAAAWLVALGCVSLRELWLHLGPSPASVCASWSAIDAALAAEARPNAPFGLGVAGISAFAVPVAEGSAAAGSYSSSLPEPSTVAGALGWGNTLSASAGSADPWTHPAAAVAAAIENAGHQKVGLLAGLLRVGAWPWACQVGAMLAHEAATGLAADLSAPLPVEVALQVGSSGSGSSCSSKDLCAELLACASDSCIDLCAFPSVALAACALLHAALQPAYCAATAVNVRGVLSSASVVGGMRPTSVIAAEASMAATSGPTSNGSCPLSPFLAPLERVGDLPGHLSDLLTFLGPHLACDPLLHAKLLRCLRASISTVVRGADQGSEPATALAPFFRLSSNVVLPALSLSGSNSALAFDAWECLRLLPWAMRYQAYTLWKDVAPSSRPILAFAKHRAASLARALLKRISAETVKQYGRALAKALHCGPLAAGEVVVSTLETYSNLAPHMTEALRFSGPLSLDVVAFTLIDRLTNAERGGLAVDGVGQTESFATLAAFAGAFFRRYCHVDVAPLVHAVTLSLAGGAAVVPLPSSGISANAALVRRQLDASPWLAVLRELVSRVAGLEAPQDLTAEQLEALSGSDLLRVQYCSSTLALGPSPAVAGTPGARVSPDPVAVSRALERVVVVNASKRAAAKLRDALLSAPRPAAVSLYVLLVQLQDASIYGAPRGTLGGFSCEPSLDLNDVASLLALEYDWMAPPDAAAAGGLRALTGRLDAIHSSLQLYSEFIHAAAAPSLHVFAAQLPPFEELCLRHRLPVSLAWQLVRPVVRAASYPTAAHAAAASAALASAVDSSAPPSSVPSVGDDTTAAVDVAAFVSHASAVFSNASPWTRWTLLPHPSDFSGSSAPLSSETLFATVRRILPHLLPSMPYTEKPAPAEAGSRELEICKFAPLPVTPELYVSFWAHSLSDVHCPVDAYDHAVSALKDAVTGLDAVSASSAGATDREKLRGRYLDAIKRLRADAASQVGHVRRVHAAALVSQNDAFFAPRAGPDAVSAFVLTCLLPRALLGLEDAAFAARFTVKLHELGTPCFPWVTLVDCLVAHVTPHIIAVTESEAASLGVLLAEVLAAAQRTLSLSPSAFDSAAAANATFSLSFTDPSGPRITHEKYAKVLASCWDKVRAVVVTALSSSDAAHAKNALILLKRLLPLWPHTKRAAAAVLAATEKLRGSGGGIRADVRVIARLVHGSIEKRFPTQSAAVAENGGESLQGAEGAVLLGPASGSLAEASTSMGLGNQTSVEGAIPTGSSTLPFVQPPQQSCGVESALWGFSSERSLVATGAAGAPPSSASEKGKVQPLQGQPQVAFGSNSAHAQGRASGNSRHLPPPGGGPLAPSPALAVSSGRDCNSGPPVVRSHIAVARDGVREGQGGGGGRGAGREARDGESGRVLPSQSPKANASLALSAPLRSDIPLSSLSSEDVRRNDVGLRGSLLPAPGPSFVRGELRSGPPLPSPGGCSSHVAQRNQPSPGAVAVSAAKSAVSAAPSSGSGVIPQHPPAAMLQLGVPPSGSSRSGGGLLPIDSRNHDSDRGSGRGDRGGRSSRGDYNRERGREASSYPLVGEEVRSEVRRPAPAATAAAASGAEGGAAGGGGKRKGPDDSLSEGKAGGGGLLPPPPGGLPPDKRQRRSGPSEGGGTSASGSTAAGPNPRRPEPRSGPPPLLVPAGDVPSVRGRGVPTGAGSGRGKVVTITPPGPR